MKLETQVETINVMLDQGAYMPEKAHAADAGYDLRTPVRTVVHPHDSVTIDTGVHIDIPRGYTGFLKSKSGLNVNHDLTGEGVIDSGYTGSIRVKLYNHSGQMHIFEAGDKIIQLVILPVARGFDLKLTDSFRETERGDGGFGSTGR